MPIELAQKIPKIQNNYLGPRTGVLMSLSLIYRDCDLLKETTFGALKEALFYVTFGVSYHPGSSSAGDISTPRGF